MSDQFMAGVKWGPELHSHNMHIMRATSSRTVLDPPVVLAVRGYIVSDVVDESTILRDCLPLIDGALLLAIIQRSL